MILDVDPRISETIKRKAPTFMFNGNIASFYPRSTKHVSLMFTPAPPCPTRLDCWKERATPPALRFLNEPDLAAKTDALRGLIAAWIELKS